MSGRLPSADLEAADHLGVHPSGVFQHGVHAAVDAVRDRQRRQVADDVVRGVFGESDDPGSGFGRQAAAVAARSSSSTGLDPCRRKPGTRGNGIAGMLVIGRSGQPDPARVHWRVATGL